MGRKLTTYERSVRRQRRQNIAAIVLMMVVILAIFIAMAIDIVEGPGTYQK